MYAIFLSYRRADSEPITHDIYKWLTNRLPKTYAFFDNESMLPGATFPKEIETAIRDSSVVLVVIGPRWLTVKKSWLGGRRLDDPEDYVRQEIEWALQYDRPIIPLLVDGAEMPKAGQTPPSIASIHTRHAITVKSGTPFDAAMLELQAAIVTYNPWLAPVTTDAGKPVLVDLLNERSTYLATAAETYRRVSLPIDTRNEFALDDVYQPLRLRRDPVIAEDQTRLNRRDEPEAERKREEHPRDARRKGDGPSGANRPEEAKEERGAREATSIQVVEARDGVDALRQSASRRMIVLGGPGTGKTTLLRRMMTNALAGAIADVQKPVPIFIRLTEWARSGKPLEAYLEDEVARQGAEPAYAALLWQVVKKGMGYFCLDGLDEVKSDLRPDIIRQINDATYEYGGTWIIGSRFTEYKGRQFDRGSFVEWELKALDHEQRMKLARDIFPILQKLLPDHPASAAPPETFVEQLEAHPQAASWGDVPLLFSLAAYVYVRNGALPVSRAELYRATLNGMMYGRDPDVDRNTITRLTVADLSLDLFTRGEQAISRDDIMSRLPYIRTRLMQNWADDEMIKRVLESGALDPIASETFGFRHPSFLEYLTAVALAHWLTEPGGVRKEEMWALIHERCARGRWAEPLRLMVGILVNDRHSKGPRVAQQWLHDLATLHETDDDPGLLAFALAVQSASEITEYLVDRAPETFLEELRELVKSWENMAFRAQLQKRRALAARLLALGPAIAALPACVGSAATGPLGRLIDDGDDERGRFALEVSRSLGPYAPLDNLLRALDAQHADRSLNFYRGTVLEVLSELGEFAPLDLFINALDSDTSTAARALGRRGDQRAVEPLLRKLRIVEAQKEPDNHQRIALGVALVRLGYDAGIESLLRARHVHYAGDVYERANEAIAELGDRAVEPLIRAALGGADESVRIAAVGALSHLKDARAVPCLLSLLSDPAEEVRRNAMGSLGTIGDERALAPLLALLNDPKAVTQQREDVINTLGWLGDPRAYDAIIGELSHYGMIEITAFALGRFSDVRAIGPLMDILLRYLNGSASHSHRESGEITAVLNALGKLGDRTVCDSIARLLQDKESSIRSSAMRALGRLKDPRALEPLLTELAAKSGYVSQSAIETLGVLGDPRAILALTKAMDDSHESAAIAAAKALGQIADADAIAALLVAMETLDWNKRKVKDAIRDILIQLGASIVGPLVQAFDKSDAPTRRAAANVLLHLGDQAPFDPLVHALADPDEEVRFLAIQAMGSFGDRAAMPVVRSLADRSLRVIKVAKTLMWGITERLLLETLTQAMRDPEPAVRINVARAIGELEERAPVDALVQALTDEDAQVRLEVVKALSALGPRNVTYVSRAVKDNDITVRQAAIEVLGSPGWDAMETIATALGDPDWQVRVVAVEYLSHFGDLAFDHLARMTLDGHHAVAEVALLALWDAIERVPLAPVKRALTDADVEVRRAAAKVCERLGPVASVELPLQALQDTDSTVRKRAIGALAKYGDRAPVRQLAGLLDDEDRYIRLEVIHALGQLGNHAPVAELLRELNGDCASAAIEALGRTGSERAVAPLMDILSGKRSGSRDRRDGGERVEAAEALGAIGAAGSAGALAKVLDDRSDDAHVRAAVAVAIGQINAAAPEARLTRVLMDRNEDISVRAGAANGLGYVSGQTSVGLLAGVLADTNEDLSVRCAAARTLGRAGELAPVEQLGSMLRDKEDRLRVAATDALMRLGHRGLRWLVGMWDDRQSFVHSLVWGYLNNDHLRDWAGSASEAFERLGRQTQVDIVRSALSEDTLRVAAVWKLGTLKPPDLVNSLMPYLGDSDKYVRGATITILGRSVEQIPISVFERALDDEDDSVREDAIGALASLGERAPLDLLAHGCEKFGDRDHREEYGIPALKPVGVRAAPILLQYIGESKDQYVGAAQTLLWRFDAATRAKVAVQALADEDSNVRYGALIALKLLGSNAPLEPVYSAIGDSEKYRHLQAFDILERQKDRVPLEFFVRVFNDGDEELAEAAGRVLRSLDYPGAKMTLQPLPSSKTLNRVMSDLSAEREGDRSNACGSLAAIDDPQTINLLRLSLADSSSYVQRAAADALMAHDRSLLLSVAPEAEMILYGRGYGETLGERHKAYVAGKLAELAVAHPSVVALLVEYLDSPFWDTRREAAIALGAIRRNIPDAAILRLQELRRDKRFHTVSIAAEDALAEILAIEGNQLED